MSLTKGDRLVIKRGGHILTPDAGEAYHEFEVMEEPEAVSFKPDGSPVDASYVWQEGDVLTPGYVVKVRVIR